MTFLEANQYCYKKGGSLLVINNHEEETEIFGILRNEFERTKTFWAGVSRAFSKEIWLNFETLKPLKYVHWQPDKFSNLNDLDLDANCMEYTTLNNGIYSSVTNCDHKKPFICKI